MKLSSILDRLFPAKYNFFDNLTKQAQINARGIFALSDWLSSGNDADEAVLKQCAREADEIRMRMEQDLVNAFSTPIDRGDIYHLSVDMDKVVEYALSTILSMKAFKIAPNGTISGMVSELMKSSDLFLQAVERLKGAPAKSEQLIPGMRQAHTTVEQRYRDGMAALFDRGNPMEALKLREVYHHIKDASSNLDYSVDTLHRIIVGLV